MDPYTQLVNISYDHWQTSHVNVLSAYIYCQEFFTILKDDVDCLKILPNMCVLESAMYMGSNGRAISWTNLEVLSNLPTTLCSYINIQYKLYKYTV